MEKKSTTFAVGLIVLWCNGSTTVFGSVSGGSNPPGTTSRKTTPQALGLRGCFLMLDHAECYLLMRRMRRGKCPFRHLECFITVNLAQVASITLIFIFRVKISKK